LLYFAKTVADRDWYDAAQEKGELIKRYCADLCGNVMIASTAGKHSGGVSSVSVEDIIAMDVPIADLEAMMQYIEQEARGMGNQPLIIGDGMLVEYPLMHHKFLDDRMVVARGSGDLTAGRGHLLDTWTLIIPQYRWEKE
jgi:hypothetical protein